MNAAASLNSLRPKLCDTVKTTETNNEGVSSNEFFDAFHNKFIKKDAGYRFSWLKAYCEDGQMKNLAMAIFDFSLDGKKHFEFLFSLSAKNNRI